MANEEHAEHWNSAEASHWVAHRHPAPRAFNQLLITGERHLRQVLTEYLRHYNTADIAHSASSHPCKPAPGHP